MPELPEVETTLRGITDHIKGKKVSQVIVRKRQLRWLIPMDLPVLLHNKYLLGITRRGKYLLLEFMHGTAIFHLGMSGTLCIVATKKIPEKHDHVDICFGRTTLRFNDPRRFGCLLWHAGEITEHRLLQHLGPEPLTAEFTAEYLFISSRKRMQPVKQFIMDSKVVVGVGNIYANESLFKAQIKPLRKACRLSRKNCEDLVRQIKEILKKAIEQGGTTLKDFVGGDGKPGYFKQELLVYGRAGEPCVECGKALKESRLGQRSTVYCTHCQK